MDNDILIFGRTIKDAELFFRELYEKIKPNVDVIKMSNHRFEMFTKDGTHYRVMGADDSARGTKYKKAYVQHGVSPEFINGVIRLGFRTEEDIEYFD